MSKPEPSVYEIAERIAGFSLVSFHDNQTATRGQIAAEIVSALKARDERAAKICEQGAMLASPRGVIPAGDPEHEHLQRLSDALNSAARAIREGKE